MSQEASGLSMRDVGAAVRAVERVWRVFIEHRLVFPTYEGDPSSVIVVCEVVAAGEGRAHLIGKKVTGRFPTVAHKTVVGLMFRLVYDLDHVLDEVEEAGEEWSALPLFAQE